MVSSVRVSAFALSLLLQLGSLVQPPTLPPEPEPPSPVIEPPAIEPPSDPKTDPKTDPQTDPAAIVVPAGLEPVEFPLDAAPQSEEPLPRMDPSPSSQAPRTRRSIVDLRDPFDRPPLRPRTPSTDDSGQALAHRRLLMPDLKDPFAEGTRAVRSRTLDLRVPSDLRDPFRDGLGRTRAQPCQRTTHDGTVVQAPGAPPIEECSSEPGELHDPFRGDTGKLPPPPN